MIDDTHATVTVRPARPADAPAIGEIHVQTWQHAYAHTFPAEALAGLDVERRVTYWRGVAVHLPARSALLVAVVGGRVVGFASVGPARDEDWVGELYAIYVLPEQWGTRVGRELMQEALRALAAASFVEAILWVLEDNPRARAFYERGGWAADGATKREDFLGVAVTEVRYRISLLRSEAGEAR